MRFHVGIVLTLGVGAICDAQQPTQLQGIVRDPNGVPISDARITISGKTAGVRTNADGRFVLRQALSNHDRVVVLKIGYERVESRYDSLYASVSGGWIGITLRPVPPAFEGPRDAERALNIHDDTVPEFDVIGITRAAKLRALSVRRARSDQEIRLAMHTGYRARDHLVVLRSRGGRVSGELWVWAASWARDSTNRERDADAKIYGCRSERASPNVGACRAQFIQIPDWTRLWRLLDSLGVWTLPTEAELPSTSLVMTGGVTLTIEMFDGARFRSVTHTNPEVQPSPESKRAAVVLEQVKSIIDGAWRPLTSTSNRE